MSADIRMIPWSIAKWAIAQLRHVTDSYYVMEVWSEDQYRKRHAEIDEMVLAQLHGRNWLCDNGYLTREESEK